VPPGGEERGYRSPEEWAVVVAQIQAGNPAGEETLYNTLSQGARFFLRRQTATDDVDDLLHDLFLTVIAAIRAGQLREPERLMGFVRTILFRQAAGHSRHAGRAGIPLDSDAARGLADPGPRPDESAIEREEVEIMRQTLGELRPRDTEVLTRFYLRGQSEPEIREALDLTPTQFRLLKSRAKARFTQLIEERTRRKGPATRR
jgi:RNA polymerase sigma factor (sigma-70 family)